MSEHTGKLRIAATDIDEAAMNDLGEEITDYVVALCQGKDLDLTLFAVASVFACLCEQAAIKYPQACAILNSVYSTEHGGLRDGETLLLTFSDIPSEEKSLVKEP